MTKTTITLNDDDWELVLDMMSNFPEKRSVRVFKKIERKVFPDSA